MQFEPAVKDAAGKAEPAAKDFTGKTVRPAGDYVADNAVPMTQEYGELSSASCWLPCMSRLRIMRLFLACM